MKKFTGVLVLTLLMVLVVNIDAQAQDDKKFTAGNSLNIALPLSDMGNFYDYGWGIYANFDYNLNELLVARFDFGYNSFSGPDDLSTLIPEDVQMDVWEFTAGLRAKMSVFYAEARGGYFIGADSWGFVPAVGLKFKKVDIQGNLTITGDMQWAGVRIGYYY